MTVWLMPQDEIDRLEMLLEKYVASDPEKGDDVSASTDDEDTLDIINGIALIKIDGVLTPKKLRWLSYFGKKQTVYSDIERKVREAEAQGATKIVFAINSPGGDMEGLYEVMQTIKASRLPTESVSGYLLTSAAYMIASQTGSITARTEASLVGSVGVATTRLNWDVVKEIANSDSWKKRPDVSTQKGVKAVQEELDDIYQIFAEMIADGRNVSVDSVKKKYGEGAVMTARTAKQRGMIDAINVENTQSKYRSTTNKQTAPAAANQGETTMNAKELKSEHRDVYDEIFALGEENGIKTERKRVSAHLVLADGSGDMDAAVEAIKAGDDVDQLVMAKHSAAAMKRDMRQARAADNPDVPEANGESRNEQAAADAKALTDFQAANPGCTVEVDIPKAEVN